MKKQMFVVLMVLASLAGCMTAPVPPEPRVTAVLQLDAMVLRSAIESQLDVISRAQKAASPRDPATLAMRERVDQLRAQLEQGGRITLRISVKPGPNGVVADDAVLKALAWASKGASQITVRPRTNAAKVSAGNTSLMLDRAEAVGKWLERGGIIATTLDLGRVGDLLVPRSVPGAALINDSVDIEVVSPVASEAVAAGVMIGR